MMLDGNILFIFDDINNNKPRYIWNLKINECRELVKMKHYDSQVFGALPNFGQMNVSVTK